MNARTAVLPGFAADAISGSARFESKLSCLINVARANNWRGCGGEARNSNHHESISAFLYGPSYPPPSPCGTPLSFSSRTLSNPTPSIAPLFHSVRPRVISTHGAFDLRFCGDGTIKKCRGDDAASAGEAPFLYYPSESPRAMMTRSPPSLRVPLLTKQRCRLNDGLYRFIGPMQSRH